MNTFPQAAGQVLNSNPFARGYDSFHIEQLLLIVYDNDRLPCFRPVQDSHAHLPDDAPQLFP